MRPPMLGEALMSAPSIRYDRATFEQRRVWRLAMLGEQRDLCATELDSEQRERLAGRVHDEDYFAFRATYGFTIHKR